VSVFDRVTTALVYEREQMILAARGEAGSPRPAPGDDSNFPGASDQVKLTRYFDTPEDNQKHDELLSRKKSGFLSERVAASVRSSFVAATERAAKEQRTSPIRARVNAVLRAHRHASVIGPVNTSVRAQIERLVADTGGV
jgi:hypothetical protein